MFACAHACGCAYAYVHVAVLMPELVPVCLCWAAREKVGYQGAEAIGVSSESSPYPDCESPSSYCS